MILWIFFALLAAFALYVLAPLVSKAWKAQTLQVDHGRQDLLYRKEEILLSLSDIEYDYKMKKIGEADYQQGKENLKKDAIEVMKKLDTVEGLARENAVRFPAGEKRKQRTGS
jgi:hypothetical protein